MVASGALLDGGINLVQPGRSFEGRNFGADGFDGLAIVLPFLRPLGMFFEGVGDY